MRCLVEPSEPVTQPEHLRDSATSQNVARVGPDLYRVAGERTVNQHPALVAERLGVAVPAFIHQGNS